MKNYKEMSKADQAEYINDLLELEHKSVDSILNFHYWKEYGDCSDNYYLSDNEYISIICDLFNYYYENCEGLEKRLDDPEKILDWYTKYNDIDVLNKEFDFKKLEQYELKKER